MPESSTDRATERRSLERKLNAAVRGALGSIKIQRPSTEQALAFLADLTGPQSGFFVAEANSEARSEQYYRFVCAPYDDSAARPLSQEVEEQFRESVIQAYGDRPPQWPPKRGIGMTTFQREGPINRKEQKLALTANGALGFVTLAYLGTWDGRLFFHPTEFLFDLASFLGAAALFYQKAEYRGRVHLRVDLHAPIPALVPDSSRKSE